MYAPGDFENLFNSFNSKFSLEIGHHLEVKGAAISTSGHLLLVLDERTATWKSRSTIIIIIMDHNQQHHFVCNRIRE